VMRRCLIACLNAHKVQAKFGQTDDVAERNGMANGVLIELMDVLSLRRVIDIGFRQDVCLRILMWLLV